MASHLFGEQVLDTKTFPFALGMGIYFLIFEGFWKIGYKLSEWFWWNWLTRLVDEETYGRRYKVMGIVIIVIVAFAYLYHVLN